MQKVVFHMDGRVTVAGVPVGVLRGVVRKWTFLPVIKFGQLDKEECLQGPFKSREPIRRHAKEVYKRLHGK